MKVYTQIIQAKADGKALFSILIDPDKISVSFIQTFLDVCKNASVDLIFIGGSLIFDPDYHEKVKKIKQQAGSIPVLIFPGALNQISANADAILFLSLISGRNPDFLIGNQVMAAPIIKKMAIETISTAYMLIESGKVTSAEFMSGSRPIPREKSDIAVAHALAAELLGFKLVYLEAGSGAELSVPITLIDEISKNISIPIIVGGGIKSPGEASEKVQAGADILVVGNHFETKDNDSLIYEFADAIHG